MDFGSNELRNNSSDLIEDFPTYRHNTISDSSLVVPEGGRK
jgi:hypothetical protein